MNLLILLPLLVVGQTQYEDVYNKYQENGKPVVLLVGAKWCPGCQTMEHNVLPKCNLRGVNFAIIDIDAEPNIARELMVGTSIPQLVFYVKTKVKWHKHIMTGVQSVGDIDQILDFARKNSEK